MSLNQSEIDELESLLKERAVCDARTNLLDFTKYTMSKFQATEFHKNYYDVLNEFAEGRIKKLIISMPPQHGKLLPINTPVLTTKGWVNHGDLKRGDIVFDSKGKQKRVISNTGAYNWNVSELKFNNGASILCSKEHLWNVLIERDDKKGRVEETLETQDILSQKNRRSPAIQISKSLDIKEKELPIDPYVFGCWLGDGTSANGNITSADIGVIDAIKKSGFDVNKHKSSIYGYNIVGLAKKLRLLGVIKNKHIPIDYLLSSTHQRMELLRGLMDTDGHCDIRGGCEFSQKVGQLSEDAYVLIRSLGYKTTYNILPMKLNGNIVGEKVRLIFRPNKTETLFKLKRKQERLSNKIQKDRGDKYRYFIKSFSGEREILGNCIEVDGGTYLAGVDLIPTHNSEGSTRRLPTYLLGKNPDTKIAIATYSDTFAKKFNRDCQRIIDSKDYHEVFEDTVLNASNVVTVSDNYLRNATEFEIVGHEGSLKAIGKGGALTGNPVDIMIMDDLYKDYMEGNSPIIRENVWDWYTTVVKTRLHNDSQELIVFTRWNEDDLIGRMEKSEQVIEINSIDDIKDIPYSAWVKINYEAIKTNESTELDDREVGVPLYPERHDLDSLKSKRALDPEKFQCLYQGNPRSKEGLMYSDFKTYKELPHIKIVKNYTDTADSGTDYLCSINYGLPLDEMDNNIYILDMLYTQKNMTEAEPLTAELLNSGNVNQALFESNNGGRYFSANVQNNTNCVIDWFHQSKNKESRIFSNNASVSSRIVFPERISINHPEFYDHITGYKKLFKANTHDDAADVLTGIIETETNNYDDLEVNWN